jgi:hypothetical protein
VPAHRSTSGAEIMMMMMIIIIIIKPTKARSSKHYWLEKKTDDLKETGQLT